ncbi:phosphatidylinositol transfer protein beta isoform-like [Folsomia candida]|uniref:phosphatidylinositol transfer protein beta isoform-like n=1 Tax=Folsomia candida TaxID=158441 RepID=UPI001604E4D0|nr:phosphatidylinositol transfer protein beta isoform-like [Folsomia candida]
MSISVESIHLEDRGDTENALNLTPDQLKIREVVLIDIGENLGSDEEAQLPEDEIPRRYRSSKTLRGPLTTNWINEAEPVMCSYKLVTCEFKVFGLQNRLENFIQKNEQRVFSSFHRRMFCWIDQWIDMTLTEARLYEEQVADELNAMRESGAVRGIRAVE